MDLNTNEITRGPPIPASPQPSGDSTRQRRNTCARQRTSASHCNAEGMDLQACASLLLQPDKGLPEWTELESYIEQSQKVASQFRDYVDTRMPNPQCSCAVCSRALPVLTCKYTDKPLPPLTMPVADIPNKQLLEKTLRPAELAKIGKSIADFPLDEYPRQGVTTYAHAGTEYCLDPEGISTGQLFYNGWCYFFLFPFFFRVFFLFGIACMFPVLSGSHNCTVHCIAA